jgi:predicted CXXCH cytochrome family protein
VVAIIGVTFLSLHRGCKQFHAPLKLEATYVGDRACQPCHKEAFQDWKISHHALSMQEATDSTVLGDFNDVVFEGDGVQTQFYKRGNRFFVNTQDGDGIYREYEVEYTFGVEPLQQYLVKFSKGRYQALRTAWDTEKGQWFDLNPNMSIAPEEWIHWSNGGSNWNVMCADCHSTDLRRNYVAESDSFHTTWSAINVSCEACHGPGKQHIDHVASGFVDGKSSDDTPLLYLTATSSSADQVDHCAPCHSRRTSVSEHYNHTGSLLNHFIPAILRPGLYHADGQILDEVFVYGSFLQSKMYHNNVRCTDCHNPHTLKLKFEGNKLCLQCHKPDLYNVPDHHFHEMDTESAECISCHMPGKNYMVNDFRRDHSFRVPRPDQSVKYGVPNACNQCHADKGAKWAASAIDRWFGPNRKPHFSDILTEAYSGASKSLEDMITLALDTSQPTIVRATATDFLASVQSAESIEARIKNLSDSANLIRYTALQGFVNLSENQRIQIASPLLSDSVCAVRMAAAKLLSNLPIDKLGKSNKALVKPLKEYINYLKRQEHFPDGLLEMAMYHQRRGDFKQAEHAYLKAIELDNYNNGARMNLAMLYHENQMKNQAEEMFRAVIASEPKYGQAYFYLGLLLAESGRLSEANQYLEKAIEIEPMNTRIYYNRGLILQNLSKVDEAEKIFKKGLSTNPHYTDIHYALSVLYLQNQRTLDAEYHAKLLVGQYPNNPKYADLLRSIKRVR